MDIKYYFGFLNLDDSPTYSISLPKIPNLGDPIYGEIFYKRMVEYRNVIEKNFSFNQSHDFRYVNAVEYHEDGNIVLRIGCHPDNIVVIDSGSDKNGKIFIVDSMPKVGDKIESGWVHVICYRDIPENSGGDKVIFTYLDASCSPKVEVDTVKVSLEDNEYQRICDIDSNVDDIKTNVAWLQRYGIKVSN